MVLIIVLMMRHVGVLNPSYDMNRSDHGGLLATFQVDWMFFLCSSKDLKGPQRRGAFMGWIIGDLEVVATFESFLSGWRFVLVRECWYCRYFGGYLTWGVGWPAMKTASSIWAFWSLDKFLPLDLFFSYTVLSLFKHFEYSLKDCVLYYFVAAPLICVGPQHLLGKTVHSPWILGPKFVHVTLPGSALRPESCFSCYPTLKLPIVLACALRHIRLHALLIRILWAFWWQKTAQKMVAKMLFCSPCFILFRGWVPTLKWRSRFWWRNVGWILVLKKQVNRLWRWLGLSMLYLYREINIILYDIRGCCYLLLYLVGKHTEHAAILGTLLIDYMFGYVFVSTNFLNMLRGPCRKNSRS